MNCEVCGASNARRRAKIEGTILNVCDRCVRSGEEVARVEIARRPKPMYTAPRGMDYSLKEDFGSIIRKNREKRNLTQEQLSAKIQEKHTIVKRIEDGWEPPLVVIKKIEKFFNISLMGISAGNDYKIKVEKGGMTLGDIAKIS
ncbi:MAG: TIGR00270 family protein [Candidatus Aenigmarchaeota archaeon]|nr:TIGR00270 family protein [Candidatus Aenigmarchaeota archaeon]